MCILVGAAVMAMAAARTRAIPPLLKQKGLRERWKVLHGLMLFFLVGYLATLVVVASSSHVYLELLTGVLFLFGAGFVFVTVTVGHDSIASLESRVAQRTVALNDARLQAESANRAKSEFLTNMSHELRTPLNAVIGFSELLRDQTFGPLNDRQGRQVGNILRSGNQLLELIDRVLELSDIETGRVQPRLEPVDLAHIARQATKTLHDTASRRGLSLLCEVPNLPPIVADRAMVRQIVFNLVENATKFTPKGGQIHLTGGAEADHVRLSVTDTGIGIKPEHHERVFGEFERLDYSFGRPQEGTGVGLFEVKTLVEMHSGTITLDSSGVTGQGSVFTVRLPLAGPSVPQQPGRQPRK